MTDRPILFRDWQVRAALEGRMTQTRRLACQNKTELVFGPETKWQAKPTVWQSVKPRDRLWVRETWCKVCDSQYGEQDWIDYRATPKYPDDDPRYPAGWGNDPEHHESLRWKPSIHMPRWASRLTLVVTNMRLERVQEISEDEARAEGCLPADFVTGRECVLEPDKGSYRFHFTDFWNTLHGPDAWDRNDEVVCLTFTVHQRNIDAMERAA